MGIVRRQFTRDFKLAAIKQLESGKGFARVARELELHENTLRRWKEEFDRRPSQAFPGLGKKVEESREAELERKIGQMTMENDFLKKVLQRLEEERRLQNINGGRPSGRKSKRK
jgi:transposase